MICPVCGASDEHVVPVWQDPNDFQAGEEPDYVGCTDCHTMTPMRMGVLG